ncbi:phosphoribosyltransferase [Amycolatopsis decaplanina]|uniref:Putative phosphoribosyltransferase n=1 Tax=Amycolatopsis decaplanina DSM 44594 TaxID=1284240 RepID=M2YAM0_9PSEU|nr:phosphoribosyltransferase [Amycolatopsis decaplanina]EME58635.1 putative phosphoribosyltransferase [Amycolatopsis decaplanina DSM 44594]
MTYADRADAGRRLARRLEAFRDEDTVVLGLPRGGVPVAFEVARALSAPLDVIMVRKLGVPYQPELAMGAIGEDDVRVVDMEVVRCARVSGQELAAVERAERAELRRRVERFRAGRERIPLSGRTALVIDDGVATGSTARVACQVARAQGAAKVVLAVPVGASTAVVSLRRVADEVICLETPTWFVAVGRWYRDFRQTSDDEVADLLRRAALPAPEPAATAMGAADPIMRDDDVEMVVGGVGLAGHLTVPENPVGVVVFAHGSGSSRHSPRNRYVAATLNDAGLGTLLFDLLTPREELDRTHVFDIELLAHRLIEVTRWLTTQPDTAHLPVGYFGASTGAGAALWAAADSGVTVHAIVSRGGRPDLAAQRLGSVHAPTLLIVGAHDEVVLDLNRRARAAMPCDCEIAVVPGATHLFEEPGTLERAAALARDWFVRYLRLTSGSPAE